MQNRLYNRKHLLVAGLISCAVLAVGWLAWRTFYHPEFGRIYRTGTITHEGDRYWQTPLERMENDLRKMLRFQPRPFRRGLLIGPAHMGWAMDGNIYLWDTDSSEPLWEFALSARERLEAVTPGELRCEFYGLNDPRGTNVFGSPYQGEFKRTAWEGNAIRVGDGQVFFARLATNRSTVYAIQLGQSRLWTNRLGMRLAQMSVKYVIVTDSPPGNTTGTSQGSR